MDGHSLDGDWITLTPGPTTRMAGPSERMKFEDADVKALRAATSARVNEGMLELRVGKTLVARCRRAGP